MSELDLYMILPSAPCRAVLLTANALGLSLNRKMVDLSLKEQLKPDFVKMNPQHCIPTLVDGDFIMWESRAIMAYMVQQYGKDDSLYPKDAKIRARVDHLLYFDMGTLFLRFRYCYRPVVFDGEHFDPKKEEAVCEALGWLDAMIGDKKWAACNQQTIADHALAASLATLENVCVAIDFQKYPNVTRWLQQCKKELAGYEENHEGAKTFGDMFKRAMAKLHIQPA